MLHPYNPGFGYNDTGRRMLFKPTERIMTAVLSLSILPSISATKHEQDLGKDLWLAFGCNTRRQSRICGIKKAIQKS